jgi:branched-chain amino acid transport system permease protein
MKSSTAFAIREASRVILLACLAALLPWAVDLFRLTQLTVYVVMGMVALSLALVWGFGGILSFGQTAFFGIGAYAYAMAALNFGDSTAAILIALGLGAATAAVIGYFIFYGRISDVYVGVITLTCTLILFSLMNGALSAYHVGEVAFGGFNGIPSVPGLQDPWSGDDIDPQTMWYVCAGLLILLYGGIRLLLASPFGRVLVAVRENPTRVSLLGYDPRRYQLVVFTLGGAMAGLAGGLFAAWGSFVSPTVFNLSLAAEAIVWVVVGGLGTLFGPIVGCVLVQYLTTGLGQQSSFNPNLALGAILVLVVLFVRGGIAAAAGTVLATLHRALARPRPEPTRS